MQDSHNFDRRWFGFRARDCVNGTLMPRKHLPSIAANYTLIHQIFQHHGITNKLDTNEDKIPYETDITIYNKTKVKTFEITITDNLSHLIFLFTTNLGVSKY